MGQAFEADLVFMVLYIDIGESNVKIRKKIHRVEVEHLYLRGGKLLAWCVPNNVAVDEERKKNKSEGHI